MPVRRVVVPSPRRRAGQRAAAVALFGLCAALLPTPSRAATRVPAALADGVFVLRDTFEPGRQPDGNSVIFAARGGLVIVDTGRHAEQTQALLDFAAQRGAPIRAVVNSHWHLDHLGGNAMIRDHVPDVQVIASAAVAPALRGWLAASRRDMQALLDSGRADAATQAMLRVDIALIDRGPALRPDRALDARRMINPAGQRLQVGYEAAAVTGGDLWVYDPSSRVLAAGDLVTLPVPFLDTACAPGWRTALAHLEAVPFEQLIPGHGAPMSRADFTAWRSAFDSLLTCTAGHAPDTACIDGWIGALGSLLPTAEHPRARAMLGYYVKQHLRAEPAQRDRFCAAPATSSQPR